ncbi:nucleotidyltransferase domain-containing protein [Bradyrhizobium sp.]|uniref:nucleotidyltransferase domain-containing protein n=1 Tax=Bradyrhizobium sp. TaxID=376 RepID=UPI0025B8A76F|nr:nucleotidyltransferase domain-containing protein [Bradyrhizobium sp.]
MEAIERAKGYSEGKLSQLRNAIKHLVPADEMVVINGSFARREASAGSDIDFYIVTSGNDVAPPFWAEAVREKIAQTVPISPAENGAFAKVEHLETLIRNIGGEHDDNYNITRRMLLLLEGEWLFNEAGLKDIRRRILERYIAEGMKDHQLALFLLNDVVRYYRTLAVDYEFKTVEISKVKPWGIRNIKLMFSRKLLYASGLFSVATTADRNRSRKISELERLFNLPVIERMVDICGNSNSQSVLESYDRFLNELEKEEVRAHLKGLDKDGREDIVFRDLKNEGHHFTRELLKLFERTFDTTHPIRRAIIF